MCETGACNVSEKDPAIRGGNPTKVQCCREGNQLKKNIKGQMLVRDVRHRMKSDIYDLGESNFY